MRGAVGHKSRGFRDCVLVDLAGYGATDDHGAYQIALALGADGEPMPHDWLVVPVQTADEFVGLFECKRSCA
jgi:hypothetical protein